MNVGAKKCTPSLSDRLPNNNNINNNNQNAYYVERRTHNSPKERLNLQQQQQSHMQNNELMKRNVAYNNNMHSQEMMPHYGPPPIMYHVNQFEQYPIYLPNYPNYRMPMSPQNSYYVQLPTIHDRNYYQYNEYYPPDEMSVPQDNISQEEYEYYNSDYDTITSSNNEQFKKTQNESMKKSYRTRQISRSSQTYLTDNVNTFLSKNPIEYVETEICEETNQIGMITVGTQTPDAKRILDALTEETKNIASKTNKVEDYDTIMKKINKYFTNSIGNHLEIAKEEVS